MTLLTEKNTILKIAGTGSQEINLTGAFQPKAIILYATGQNTINGSQVTDYAISLGFSDGTNDACEAVYSDLSSELEACTYRNDSVIAIYSNITNAIVAQADVTSFDSDGFTLNWSVGDSTQYFLHYIAIGGTDITNVSVVSTTVGATSTGNKSYTGSGASWTPDFAFMFCGPDGYTTVNSAASSADQALFNVGAAVSPTKEFVMWTRDETVGTSDCDSYINNAACLSSCSVTTGAITFLADFVSFNNAAGGGITVNVTDGADAATKRLAFLLIEGGTWDCGTFTQRSGTGTQDVTLTAGLDPSLVFVGGNDATANATVTASIRLSVGASDGTRQGYSSICSENGLATWSNRMLQSNTSMHRIVTGGAITLNECGMNDMATAGKFQLNWTTADATLRQMCFWAVGAAAGAAAIPQSLFIEWEED